LFTANSQSISLNENPLLSRICSWFILRSLTGEKIF